MGPVTGVTAQRFANTIQLNWTNPTAADFMGTTVRFKTTSYPTGPTDGTFLVDKSNAPGTAEHLFTHWPGQGKRITMPVRSRRSFHCAPPALITVLVVPGDFDNDADVDQSDFGHLQNCMSGDGVAYIAACEGRRPRHRRGR